MSLATAGVDQPRSLIRPGASSWLSIAYILVIVGVTLVHRDARGAVYLLSFCHYYLYWLAYRFGGARLRTFKRDAMLMKSVALVMLGWVYFSAPLNFLSLTLVATGFALNGWGAWALGADRTYYGYELAALPAQRITRLPYSWISHPMLIGNVLAYSATLANPVFLANWWPLAGAHVALNLGLLLMERYVRPLRLRTQQRPGRANFPRDSGSPESVRYLALAAALAIGAAAIGAFQAGRFAAIWLGAAVFCYVYGMYRCYSTFEVGTAAHSSEEVA